VVPVAHRKLAGTQRHRILSARGADSHK
jgi:hypothetical protein